MTTQVRNATLLDILGVLTEMQMTERGQLEIVQSIKLGGPPSIESIAADLWQRSSGIVAMVHMAEPSRALSVAGFIPNSTGGLRTWMFTPDTTWESFALDLTKHTAEGIKAVLETVHRIETYCLDSHERAQRWYARIGLHKETTLANYCTDGSDAALFVITRGTT